MLSLNLLSPAKKQEILRQMIFISLQNLISWAFISICAAGMVLLATKLILQNSFNQAVRQGALVTQEYGALNQKVYILNQQVDFLSNLQNNFIFWSPRLAALASLTPKNIELATFSLSNTSRGVQITGRASTREDLLFFKDRLQASPLLQSVNVPIENILEAKNVNFNISAKLSP